MPVEFEISDALIIIRMAGTYSTSDLREAILKALAQGDGSNPAGMIFDVSGSESLRGRTPQEVTAMGYFLATQSDRFGGRIALIGHDDFRFGMMRLGSVVLDQQGITNQVFRSEAEGRQWLRKH